MVCRRGAGVCLSRDFICDGFVDCLNAEDELNCENLNLTTLAPTTPVVTQLTTTTLPPRIMNCTKDQFTCSKYVRMQWGRFVSTDESTA